MTAGGWLVGLDLLLPLVVSGVSNAKTCLAVELRGVCLGMNPRISRHPADTRGCEVQALACGLDTEESKDCF